MLPLRLFFKRCLILGATAYGGPGMITQIKETVVNEHGWVEEEDFLRGLALCQLIPGATMVQMVTYVGYRLKGISGALTAAIAFVLPAFIALLVLSAIYFKVQSLWFIQSLFRGLGAIVVAIILNTCIAFGKSIFKDWKVILISALSFFGFFLKWNILLVFTSAALAALLLRPKGGQTKSAPFPKALHQARVNEKGYLFLVLLAVFICLMLIICYQIDPRVTSLSPRLSKIGALAFGGGFTILPMIQYEMVDRLQWLSTEDFLSGIALGQVTPGPIMITATFIGYKLSGLLGAFMATIGIFFPSFFILILVLPHYDRLSRIESVRTMERGILGSFIGMLGLVLYNFGRTALIDIPSLALAIAAFIALLKRIGLPYILISGGVLSILLFGLLI